MDSFAILNNNSFEQVISKKHKGLRPIVNNYRPQTSLTHLDQVQLPTLLVAFSVRNENLLM